MIPVRDANGNVIMWVPATHTPQRMKELGLPLLTHAEWWAQAGLHDRRAWLEAEYAASSQRVKRLEERNRKCSACFGGAVLRAVRHNWAVPVICPRCHGVKEDVAVVYW
jgi:hypothetical protein